MKIMSSNFLSSLVDEMISLFLQIHLQETLKIDLFPPYIIKFQSDTLKRSFDEFVGRFDSY